MLVYCFYKKNNYYLEQGISQEKWNIVFNEVIKVCLLVTSIMWHVIAKQALVYQLNNKRFLTDQNAQKLTCFIATFQQ